MKQEKGSKNCVAIVACMATGCSIEEFNLFMGHDCKDGVTDFEFYKFLLSREFVVGLGIESGWNVPLKFNEKTKIELEYDLNKFPAYVVVRSDRYPENGHAIYWDGKQVWDPNPDVEDGLPISKYEIYRWIPIISADNVSSESCPSQFRVSVAEGCKWQLTIQDQ